MRSDWAGWLTRWADAGLIDAATAEVFRDEVVAYASAIWAVGGVAELHVWAGGFHGFDMIVPQAALSIQARDVRTKWVRRILGA